MEDVHIGTSTPLVPELPREPVVQLHENDVPRAANQVPGERAPARAYLQYGVRPRTAERLDDLPLKTNIHEEILSERLLRPHQPTPPLTTPSSPQVRRTNAVRSSTGLYGVATSAISNRTSTM